ncbi:MAG TPA: DUF58 domain-containing protein [Streptosporangiaceae bacterium]|nr:DUF58 domain-containing protein [Streptosporangiaceae bacterium]
MRVQAVTGRAAPRLPGAGSAGPRLTAHAVTWRAAPRLRRLATVSLLALLAAAGTGRAGLLLLAAPALAALAVRRGRPRPATVQAETALSATRCFEGEEIELTVALVSPQILDEVTLDLELAGSITLVAGPAAQTVLRGARPGDGQPAGRGAQAVWLLRPGTWGRRTPGLVRIGCRSGGIWQAGLELGMPAVEVFPHPPPARPWLVPADLRRRIGEHAARTAGGGVEFSGIREHVPGDRLRDVNWAVSRRRGRLHANQRAAEYAADLIVMIDGFSEVGPAGDSSIDVSVRGAAAVASAYLKAGDQVGAVALGGMLRWLSPGASSRQFYRIAERLFDVRNDSVVTPDLDRIPRTALPPGALVILFSPLLDQRAIGAVTDLRERGFALVVVDVLRHEPPALSRYPVAALTVRLWRLDRAALRTSLAGLGVPVVPWSADDALDAVIAPLRRVAVPARRP